MDRRILLTVLLVLVAIGVAAAIGVNAYQAGLARGLADSGAVPQPAPGGPPYGYYGPYWHGPFGFGGFGFFGFLLFFFLIVALLKGLFWRPWGWHGRYGPGTYEEWHRRAHESMKEGGQKV